MSNPRSLSIILLAGGQGTRMGTLEPKQFLPLAGKPVALHSFDRFIQCPDALEIIIVCDPKYHAQFPLVSHPVIKFALPGKRRQDSVFNGLSQVNPNASLVCVHDAARPLWTLDELHNLVHQAKLHQAASLAVRAKNTIKESSADQFISRTLDRSLLWEMHTPQIATLELLKQGFDIAIASHLSVTDETSLVQLTGHRVKLVEGSYRNIKITTPDDLTLAEALIAHLPRPL